MTRSKTKRATTQSSTGGDSTGVHSDMDEFLNNLFNQIFIFIIGALTLPIWLPFALLFGFSETSFDRMVRRQQERDDLFRNCNQEIDALVDESESLSIAQRRSRLQKIIKKNLAADAPSDLVNPIFIAAVKLGLEDMAEERLTKIYIPSTIEEVAEDISIDLLKRAAGEALVKKQFLYNKALTRLVTTEQEWLSDFLTEIKDLKQEGLRNFLKTLHPLGSPELQSKVRDLAWENLSLDDAVLIDIITAESLDLLYVDAKPVIENALGDLTIVEFNESCPYTTAILLAQCADKVLSLTEQQRIDTIKSIADFLEHEYDMFILHYELSDLFDPNTLDRATPAWTDFFPHIISRCQQSFSGSLSLLRDIPSDAGMEEIITDLVVCAFNIADPHSPDDWTNLYATVKRLGGVAECSFGDQVNIRRAAEPSRENLAFYSFLASEAGEVDAFGVGLKVLIEDLKTQTVFITSPRVIGDVAHERGDPVSVSEPDEEWLESDLDVEKESAPGVCVIRDEYRVNAPLLSREREPLVTPPGTADLLEAVDALEDSYIVDLFDGPDVCGDLNTSDVHIEELAGDEFIILDEDNQRLCTSACSYDYEERIGGFNGVTGEGVAADPIEIYWGAADINNPFKLRLVCSASDESHEYTFDVPFSGLKAFKEELKSL